MKYLFVFLFCGEVSYGQSLYFVVTAALKVGTQGYYLMSKLIKKMKTTVFWFH